MKKIALFGTICLIIDQIIKIIVVSNLDINQSINVIHNFFNITYVRNYGAAFSILTGNRILLILVTVLALLFIYFIFIKNQKSSNFENVVYGILFGGITGNLVDRVVNSYVIDYLDFNLFGYNFPIFNFADICIVVSIFLIIIMTFKGDFKWKSSQMKQVKE